MKKLHLFSLLSIAFGAQAMNIPASKLIIEVVGKKLIPGSSILQQGLNQTPQNDSLKLPNYSSKRLFSSSSSPQDDGYDPTKYVKFNVYKEACEKSKNKIRPLFDASLIAEGNKKPFIINTVAGCLYLIGGYYAARGDLPLDNSVYLYGMSTARFGTAGVLYSKDPIIRAIFAGLNKLGLVSAVLQGGCFGLKSMYHGYYWATLDAEHWNEKAKFKEHAASLCAALKHLVVSVPEATTSHMSMTSLERKPILGAQTRFKNTVGKGAVTFGKFLQEVGEKIIIEDTPNNNNTCDSFKRIIEKDDKKS